MSSIIFVDLESLIKSTDPCKSIFHKWSRKKVGHHILCGYSMSTLLTFYSIEDKHDVYTVWILKIEHNERTIPWTNKFRMYSEWIHISCQTHLRWVAEVLQVKFVKFCKQS